MKRILFLIFFLSILFYLLLLPKKTRFIIPISPIPSTLFTKPYSLIPTRYPLSLSSVFNKLPVDPKQSVKINPGEYILIVTGDVIPARSVNWKMTQLNNFRYPFEKTAELLKTGNVLFINLEAPLLSTCPVTNEGIIFCGNPRFIEGLKFAQVDIANIANNHFENYGVEGTNSTINLLEKNNILVVDNNKIAIKQVKDKKFGFLGFNFIPGGQIAKEENVRSLILDLRKKTDFVVVSFHWGEEYTNIPNQQQINMAHMAIETGADLIIGNHPHWIGALEIYKNKPIVYAHGNFIFDQMWSQETREGIIGKYIFDDQGVKDILFYPVIIEDYSQPRFADKLESEEIINRMKEASEKLENQN